MFLCGLPSQLRYYGGPIRQTLGVFMLRSITFGLLLMFAIACSASERAVVATRFSGMTLQNHEQFTFLPGELVTLLQQGEKQSLIESYSRSWATTGGVWVPNEILVHIRSFEKIQHWPGDREVSVGGGDYDATYKFDSTGAFTITEYVEFKTYKSPGHLYQYKTLIWARISTEKKPQLTDTSMFLLMPNGKLCNPFDTCNSGP